MKKQLTTNDKLQKIVDKFQAIETSESNYSIGGGLVNGKFASRRHEDAKQDYSRITLGEANRIFVNATGLDLEIVSEIIKYAVPNMEWHHAGRLPKNYGGGMKKTYFLNANEIVDIATNFDNYKQSYEIQTANKNNADLEKRNKEQMQLEYLKQNAVYVIRTDKRPEYFFETKREMHGKYGWFDCSNKSYNMPIFYTGWVFETNENLQFFISQF